MFIIMQFINWLRRSPIGSKGGFTLIEIIMSMAIFSFVLMIIISSINGLYRIYQAGVGIRDTQQHARTISEELTRATRDAAHIVAGSEAVCVFYPASRVGDTLQTPSQIYALVDGGPLARKLVTGRTSIANIPAAGAPCNLADYGSLRDLTSTDVSVMLFSPTVSGPIVSTPQFNTLLTFDLRIASTRAQLTELDLSNPADPICRDGEHYCSMTSLTTTVEARSQITGGGE